MLTAFRDLFAPPRHMILLLAAAWIGLLLTEKRVERYRISKEQLNNLIFYGLLAFVIGGRISFILQNITAFSTSPLDMISINPDIFDISGAFAATFVVCLIYIQRQKLEFWNTLDALVPFFAIIAIGLGLSHLAAGTAFGKETSLPWGIELWNAQRHPTQIYDTLASLVIFGLLWFKTPNIRPGLSFLNFAALTAASSLFNEAFRGDSAVWVIGLRQNQIASWAVLALCFILMETRFTKNKNSS